jgi:hypothetical protein
VWSERAIAAAGLRADDQRSKKWNSEFVAAAKNAASATHRGSRQYRKISICIEQSRRCKFDPNARGRMGVLRRDGECDRPGCHSISQPIIGDERQRATALTRISMGRFGTPDDLIGATIFLLSPATAFVTGQILFIDGGRTIS